MIPFSFKRRYAVFTIEADQRVNLSWPFIPFFLAIPVESYQRANRVTRLEYQPGQPTEESQIPSRRILRWLRKSSNCDLLRIA